MLWLQSSRAQFITFVYDALDFFTWADLKSNNHVYLVPFVSLELPLRSLAVRARLPYMLLQYAATLLIRRIVSESHFCSHACWLLSLTLVRCNRYCKPKVRPKNRAVGGVALAGLGIVHILSSVSMVTCAFSHCQRGSWIQKIGPFASMAAVFYYFLFLSLWERP